MTSCRIPVKSLRKFKNRSYWRFTGLFLSVVKYVWNSEVNNKIWKTYVTVNLTCIVAESDVCFIRRNKDETEKCSSFRIMLYNGNICNLYLCLLLTNLTLLAKMLNTKVSDYIYYIYTVSQYRLYIYRISITRWWYLLNLFALTFDYWNQLLPYLQVL